MKKTPRRTIPTSKPAKAQTRPFVDNGDLFIQVHIKPGTNRIESFEARWKGSVKKFPAAGTGADTILMAWQKLERWFKTVTW